MKKVLLASTALVLSAGVAAADVSVGGDGRIGITSYDAVNDGDLTLESRIRISFSASGETDAGLAFGGSIRADNAGGGASGTDGSVFIEGSFGKLTVGDTSGAPEAAVGDASGVGLTGVGDFSELTYLSNNTGLGADAREAARWDYTTGDLGLHVSTDNFGPAGDNAYGVAVTYSAGDFSFGAGYEELGDLEHLAAGVTAAFGDATVKVVYGTLDNGAFTDDDQYAASLDYVSGATTLTVFGRKNFDGDNAFGVGVAYDLGGGASLKAGYADQEDVTNYDFGISMSF